MSKTETLFKLKSTPTKKLKKIFLNKEACGLWCIYRSGHIISKQGLQYLNKMCNYLIDKKITFNDKIEATTFLETVTNGLCDIEHSRADYDWIDKAIPYLLGKKSIVVEVIKNGNV